MWRLSACCLLALVSVAEGFGYTNYHLPQKTVANRNTAWMTAVQRGTNGCTNRQSCEGLEKVQPNFNTMAKDTFTPLQNAVLIAFDELDFYKQDYQGIVVSAGPMTSATNTAALKPGARVLFSSACTTKWTTTSWTALYGSQKAAAMHGKLMNGVDLNNANGWGTSSPDLQSINNEASGSFPTADTYMAPGWTAGGTNRASYPTLRTFQDATTSVTPFWDYLWGAGRAGGSFWPTRTLNTDRLGDDTPMENPNQQSNYLLCTEAQILGVVSEESFADQEHSHYLKASQMFEQSKYFNTYAQTNRVHHTASVTNTNYNTVERAAFTFP
eukprot:NODE_3335_length_1237_cov_386.790844_g3166_i0.p1 GENE.NODE_3335_length_1237_cov_386.790844_g3166_i0~~NODE_3335_length_1237_cov_386.790844_g3166_i0.p1  ORF type:complete len:327 (-),score=97.71 NODE_3335_length_1237_cov_386.790844_g3166_i0:201-1181(-)